MRARSRGRGRSPTRGWATSTSSSPSAGSASPTPRAASLPFARLRRGRREHLPGGGEERGRRRRPRRGDGEERHRRSPAAELHPRQGGRLGGRQRRWRAEGRVHLPRPDRRRYRLWLRQGGGLGRRPQPGARHRHHHRPQPGGAGQPRPRPDRHRQLVRHQRAGADAAFGAHRHRELHPRWWLGGVLAELPAAQPVRRQHRGADRRRNLLHWQRRLRAGLWPGGQRRQLLR